MSRSTCAVYIRVYKYGVLFFLTHHPCFQHLACPFFCTSPGTLSPVHFKPWIFFQGHPFTGRMHPHKQKKKKTIPEQTQNAVNNLRRFGAHQSKCPGIKVASGAEGGGNVGQGQKSAQCLSKVTSLYTSIKP